MPALLCTSALPTPSPSLCHTPRKRCKTERCKQREPQQTTAPSASFSAICGTGTEPQTPKTSCTCSAGTSMKCSTACRKTPCLRPHGREPAGPRTGQLFFRRQLEELGCHFCPGSLLAPWSCVSLGLHITTATQGCCQCRTDALPRVVASARHGNCKCLEKKVNLKVDT